MRETKNPITFKNMSKDWTLDKKQNILVSINYLDNIGLTTYVLHVTAKLCNLG